MVKDEIENITALASSLSHAVNEFVSGLKRLQAEAVDLERQVQMERDLAQRENERLDAAIAAKQQSHRELEASIKSLEGHRAAILKLFDVKAA